MQRRQKMTWNERRLILAMSMAATVICAWSDSHAGKVNEAVIRDPLAINSGAYTIVDADVPIPVFQRQIEFPGAAWIQVHFGEGNLGESSYIELMSLETGEIQPLDATALSEWSNSSAMLRGDAVELTLYAAPGDRDVFITVDGVTAPGSREQITSPADGTVATLCGADNRVASGDSRVGRINGCTGWLVSTGVALTAGHCTNDSGNLTGVMQFNVPPSRSDGWPTAGSVADQYPITQWTFQDNGTGDDWCIFRVGTAGDGSGRRAHVEQGFFHMTARVPPADATMRVTGYGLDNTPPGSIIDSDTPCCDANSDERCDYNCNAQSRTLQTSTGRFDELSGETLEYEVDTMPANSGSPVIRESTGHAVGIHTAGGCGDTLAGDENHGTWFGDGPLGNALNDYLGSNTVFVDFANVSDLPLGLALLPAKTVAMGVGLVPNGGTVLIAAGSYTAAAGNTFTAGTGNKAMTLTTNTGVVTIGN